MDTLAEPGEELRDSACALRCWYRQHFFFSLPYIHEIDRAGRMGNYNGRDRTTHLSNDIVPLERT